MKTGLRQAWNRHVLYEVRSASVSRQRDCACDPLRETPPELPNIDLPLAHEAMDVLKINKTIGWSADETARALTRRAYLRPRNTGVEILPNTADAKYDRQLNDRLRCSQIQRQVSDRILTEKLIHRANSKTLPIFGSFAASKSVAYPEFELSVPRTFSQPLVRPFGAAPRAKSVVVSRSRPLASSELEQLRYLAW